VLNKEAHTQKSDMHVVVKAKALLLHTFTVTENPNRYPKKYRFSLVTRIQDAAIDILRGLREANDLPYGSPEEKAERMRRQALALAHCKAMLDLIELSYELKLLDKSGADYWTRLVADVRNMTAAWHKKDRTRMG
jgi:hypothetical protein